MLILCGQSLFAQRPDKPTASELYHQLQKINFLGSVLYVAAHPDDENTRLIAFLSNDRKARTAYLSLTRGDGGQNLIGPEIREQLGVIRTQELLAARRTDGGQQFFTRANDFGYSKHPDETLAIWNKDEVLGDVVRAIRKFKPDVIVNRFNHRNPGSTHGHHTSSAMLSMEAFDLVGDASSYPSSAEEFGTWQPRRLFFNTSWWFYGSQENFEKADKSRLIELQTGSFYPSTGLSNGEIAAMSRSMHKSQGFGSTGSRGSESEWLELLKGDMPEPRSDLFAGIDTSWSRLQDGAAIGAILEKAEANFNFQDPAKMVPELMRAYKLVGQLEDPHWRAIKTRQLSELMAGCLGLYLEAVAPSNSSNPKTAIRLQVEATNRADMSLQLGRILTRGGEVIHDSLITLDNQTTRRLALEAIPENTGKYPYSSPYWLNEDGTLGMYSAPQELIGLPETPAPLSLVFRVGIGDSTIHLTRDVIYKYNDPVDGEVYQPFEVLPEITTRIPEKVMIFSDNNSRVIPVEVHAGRDNVSGSISLQHPDGWAVEPAEQTFTLNRKGEMTTLRFTLTPPDDQSVGELKPLVRMGDRFYDRELVTIDYDHIPFQRVLLPSRSRIVRIPIAKKGQHIGYIEGAGDAIPESLRQIGYTVTTIDPDEMIDASSLKQFDAIVVGIRAYNTVPELAFRQELLMEYVKNGGTMLVQYNTNRRLVTDQLAPYSLQLSRDRVTDEHSPVEFLVPDHAVLNYPNTITKQDFEGWVQERGLYFPDQWDERFTAVLGMNDKNAPQSNGSLLVAQYGKGHYIYTGLSFFRELPAGVLGAFRLFANLLSIGK
jgi:LmbE family N-acetylglucosaminyl deacetylase